MAAAASEALAALRLSYRTEWPANIVLTPEAVRMYGELFRFLLQLKKAVWGLDQGRGRYSVLSRHLIVEVTCSKLRY